MDRHELMGRQILRKQRSSKAQENALTQCLVPWAATVSLRQ